MPFLPAIGQEARPEGSGAFAAGMADALIEDAVRARIAQFGPEPLGMDIAVGIVEMRVAVRETANVVETGLEVDGIDAHVDLRSEEHTSELQSLMRISYAVFCLKKKTKDM